MPAASSPPQLTRFGLDNLDLKVDPCVDFYQYACGGWMAAHPIPADQVWWDTFSALQDRNEALLRSIAEQSMAADPKRDSTHQKIGDYYAACIDEAGADAAGSKPIEAELQRIAAINSRADLAEELGHLHRMLCLPVQGSIFPSLADPGSKEPLFGFSSYQDFQDASKVVAFVDQGGLGLPDRDYYLHDDKDSAELREKYVTHVRNMLVLLKVDSDPEKASRRVMDIEMALARSWMDVVARRDRKNFNNRYSLESLQQLTPNFDWAKFLAAVGAPASEHYLVAHPEFLKTVNSLLGYVSLDDWKTYLRWNLLRASAGLLSQPFVTENFAFYGSHSAGAQEIIREFTHALHTRTLAFSELFSSATAFAAVDAALVFILPPARASQFPRPYGRAGLTCRRVAWVVPRTEQRHMRKEACSWIRVLLLVNAIVPSSNELSPARNFDVIALVPSGSLAGTNETRVSSSSFLLPGFSQQF